MRKKEKRKVVKKARFVLDSYALLAFLQAEQGGEKVRDIMNAAWAGHALTLLSAINLGEIYYIIARKKDEQTAQGIVQDVLNLPLELLEAGTERVLAAAKIKACYPLSYADAFVAATAVEFSATIITGDPDFKALDSRFSLLWL